MFWLSRANEQPLFPMLVVTTPRFFSCRIKTQKTEPGKFKVSNLKNICMLWQNYEFLLSFRENRNYDTQITLVLLLIVMILIRIDRGDTNLYGSNQHPFMGVDIAITGGGMVTNSFGHSLEKSDSEGRG